MKNRKVLLSTLLSVALASSLILPASVMMGSSVLADSPWPKFRQNLHNTGRSAYTGPEIPELKWSFTTGTYVQSSPAIGADGTIYAGRGYKDFYAINPDGTLKWSFATGRSVWSSPAIGADGIIYVGSDDYNLYAINPDGTLKWRFTTGSYVLSSPTIGTDGTIYVGSWDNNLYAINPNGTLKWSFTTGDNVYSSPAIGADGIIYVGSRDKSLYAINPDGTERWSFTTGDWVQSSPAIGADGTIYVGSWDNNLYAINPDGTLKWTFTTGSWVQSSPAVGTDGTIYVGSRDHDVYAINPDGTLKWTFTTGDYVSSSPAVGTDGTIYVGSLDNNLYAINPDGTLKWSFTTGDRVRSSPAIGADGIIYVGSYDNKLYAIGEAAPPPDTTPPTVSSVSPEKDQPDVAINTAVTATFSEAMDASTITAASFTLAGSAVSGIVTYDAATRTATFTPDADLEYNHGYTAVLSTAITDLAGNPLVEPYGWSFTTEMQTVEPSDVIAYYFDQNNGDATAGYDGDSAWGFSTGELPLRNGFHLPAKEGYIAYEDQYDAFAGENEYGYGYYINSQWPDKAHWNWDGSYIGDGSGLPPGVEWHAGTGPRNQNPMRVLVYAPLTGKACVALIGDSGPAPWTGRQFGVSNKVFAALELPVSYTRADGKTFSRGNPNPGHSTDSSTNPDNYPVIKYDENPYWVEFTWADESLQPGPLPPTVSYTPTGSDVDISLSDAVVMFTAVTSSGTVTLTTSRGNPAGSLPSGFRLRGFFVDITTTATYTGPVTVGVRYDQAGIRNEHNLRLFHWNGNSWEDITTWVDSDNNIVYGEVASLSWFFIAQPDNAECFIATAAYGTPMADELQILREFRDECLLTNPLGQAFVHFYYKVSPPIAKLITEHPGLKPIVRAGLLPAVVMSTVAVNTTPAEKAAMVGLVVLISATVAIWMTRRRPRGPQYT